MSAESRHVLNYLSLTQRVVWTVTAVVSVLVGLQTLLAYLAMYVQEDELSDALLQHDVAELVARMRRPELTPAGALGTERNLAHYLVRGNAGRDALPPALRSLAPGIHQLEPAGRIWHVAVTDTPDGRLVVVLDATDSEARVAEFGWTLCGIWLICVAVTVWVARRVATIAVGPIVAATNLIARWSPQPADAAAPPRNEALLLMETFNRFRDGMDESVAREREFAANLDHEIRTPLTAIRTDAELLAIDAPLTPAQAARAERIMASVDEIIATAEATRGVSAGRAGAAIDVSLFECVQSACDALAGRAEEGGLAIVNAIDAGATASVDRQALLAVMRNIVRNAIEHAAPATLTVACSRESDTAGGVTDGAATLHFDDDGPGIAAAALPHVFERYYEGRRGDTGSGSVRSRRGLGLAIARRLCDLNGWRLSVRSPRPDGARGTRFELRLAPRRPLAQRSEDSSVPSVVSPG